MHRVQITSYLHPLIQSAEAENVGYNLHVFITLLLHNVFT